MKPRNPVDRFVEKVTVQATTGCWLWTAAKHPTGAGNFYFRGGPMLAHRAAWELYKGPLPENAEVWRTCDDELCVNPEHLYLRLITPRLEPVEFSADYKNKFWRNVNMLGEGCWPWRKYKDSNGYGVAFVAGTGVRAHRAAYEIAVGPVPEGERVFHNCQERSCCKPAHLYTATASDWAAERSAAGLYAGQEKTECAQGHKFTPENTYITSKGSRACKQCNRIASYKRYALTKEAAPGAEAPTHVPQALREDRHTKCPKGHELTPENTYQTTNGTKACKTCGREKDAARRLKKQAARKDQPPVERAKRPPKTECKYGHPFTPENTILVKLGRQCKTCRREYALAAYRAANPVVLGRRRVELPVREKAAGKDKEQPQ